MLPRCVLRQFKYCILYARNFASLPSPIAKEPGIPPKAPAVPKPEFVPPQSALFVSGAASQFTPFVVDPYLDFDEYFTDISRLHSEFVARDLPLNVQALKEAWDTVHGLWEHRKLVKARSKEYIQQFRPPGFISDEVRAHARKMRQEVKDVQSALAQVESDIVLQLLTMPTMLHEKTPRDGETKVIFESGGRLSALSTSEAHDLWRDSAEFTDCSLNGYFLRNHCAELELRTVQKFQVELDNVGFDPLSGPHLLKAVVLEASGTPFKQSSQAFMLDTEDSRNSEFRSLFLASHPLHVFTAYFTSGEVSDHILPLRLFHCGRIYHPRETLEGIQRLMNPAQTHCVSFCIGYGHETDTDKHLLEITQTVQDLYKVFEVPFRVTISPASRLGIFEAIRYNFDVWSASKRDYVNCGYVSANSDFISRRIRCHVGKRDDVFMRLIHGAAVYLTPFTACVFEFHGKKVENWIESKLKDL